MSEPRTFLDGRVVLHHGDCREVLKTIPDNSIDSCVVDPPYHLQSIVKRFGGKNAAPAKHGTDGAFKRASSGFMSKTWDGGDIAFQPELWAEVLRVLKPGGYAIIFGGTRTAHRMVCAIEDAGFEIRDEVLLDKDSETEYRAFEESLSDEQRRQFGKLFRERGAGRLSWQFGVGFPKSKNITASIDRCLCALPLAASVPASSVARTVLQSGMSPYGDAHSADVKEMLGMRQRLDAEEPPEICEQSVLAEMCQQANISSSDRSPIETLSEDDGGLCGVWKAENGVPSMVEGSSEPSLLPPLQRRSSRSGMGKARFQGVGGTEDKAGHGNGEEPSMEGRRYSQEAARELRRSPVRESSGMGIADGAQGSLHHGASDGNGSDVRVPFDENGSCQSRRSESSEQPSEQPDPLSDECGSQARGSWPVCGRCGKSIVPEGLGTALKPAHEPICLARKPISESSIAANVQKWGVGAINVAACKVGIVGGTAKGRSDDKSITDSVGAYLNAKAGEPIDAGRWPSNLITDGSPEVLACFPETGVSAGGGMKDLKRGALFIGETNPNITDSCGFGDSGSAARFFASFPQEDVQRKIHRKKSINENSTVNIVGHATEVAGLAHDDSGSAARYFASFPQDDDAVRRIFYTSKADSDDRLGSKHPTVKPLDLIQYLVRLITPKNGVCLDLFAGTGTTAEACFREGFRCILIEREDEYIEDIERRMSLVMEGPDTRAYASMKARNRPRDDGPLFGFEEKSREPNLRPSASPRRPYADDTAIWGNRKPEAAE